MIEIRRNLAGDWCPSEPLPIPFLAIKKPMPIKAREMWVPFTTDSLEGNELKGDIGDFLIEGIVGEYYPCNREVFLMTYDRLTFWTRLRFAFQVLFAR